MLTAKGKYGLKALVHLAKLKEGSSARASEIASASNIPKKFLDAIMSELRDAGIVQSKRGPTGGFTLVRSARLVTAGEVVRVLDGPLAPIQCASRTAYRPCRDCKSIRTCEVRRTMSLVRDATAEILDRLSIADMIHATDGDAPSLAGRRNLETPRSRRPAAARVRKIRRPTRSSPAGNSSR